MGVSHGEDDVTAKGKYALLSVPEHESDPDRGAPMTTYLRIGAASTTTASDQGTDLLQMASAAGWSPNAEKGGWRDHSDGDRTSTTRGSKSDVISGNYKKVIACDQGGGGTLREDFERKDGKLELSTRKEDVIERVDTSGERHETFTGSEYNRNIGKREGDILTAEQLGALNQAAQKDDQAVTERATVGSGTDGELEAEGGAAEEEESTVESSSGEATATGASGEASATGVEGSASAAGLRASADFAAVSASVNGGLLINENTIAAAITNVTVAGLIDESTTVGKQQSMTLAGIIMEDTWVGQSHSNTQALQIFENTNAVTIVSTTNASSITESTKAGVIMSDTHAGAIMENLLVGVALSNTVGNTIENVTGSQIAFAGGLAFEMWLGAFMEIFLGANLSLRLAGSAEVSVGIAAEIFAGAAAEMFLGAKFELAVGAGLELRVGPKWEGKTSEEKAFLESKRVGTGYINKVAQFFAG